MSKSPTTKTVGFTAKLSPTSLWAQFERSPTLLPQRRFRWVVDAVLPLTLTVVVGIAVLLLPSSLPSAARLSLFAFALAVILWSTTSLNACDRQCCRTCYKCSRARYAIAASRSKTEAVA